MKRNTVLIAFTLIAILMGLSIRYYLTNGYAITFIEKNNITATLRIRDLDEVLLPVAYYEYDLQKEYWGYIDLDGEVAIPFEYDEAGAFDEHYFAVVIKNIKYSLINTRNEPVLDKDKEYSYIQYLGENIYYYEDDTDGYFAKYENDAFNVIKREKYDVIGPFSEELAYVVKDKKVGYINTNADLVIPLNFDYVEGFNFSFISNFAFVNQNGKYGIIGHSGSFSVQPSYDEVRNEYIIKSDYQEIYYTDYEDVPVRTGDTWTYVSRDGGRTRGSQFLEAYPYIDGIARVKHDDNKYHYLNETGTTIIDEGFAIAKDFYNGYAVVGHGSGRKGLIDKNGNTVIPFVYDYVGVVNQNRVLTIKNGQSRYYNIDDLEDYLQINYYLGDDFTDCGVVFASDYGGEHKPHVILDYYGERLYPEITPTYYLQITYHGRQYIAMVAYEEASNLEYYTYLDENANLMWKVYK